MALIVIIANIKTKEHFWNEYEKNNTNNNDNRCLKLSDNSLQRPNLNNKDKFM